MQVLHDPCIAYLNGIWLELLRYVGIAFGISSVSGRYCVGIVSVSVFFPALHRHFGGIESVFSRYGFGTLSIFNRYLFHFFSAGS